MPHSNTNPQQKVIDYYRTRESRWGYGFLLKGVKHFGYYAAGEEKLSMSEAQHRMIEKLYEVLDLHESSLILDAGCGEGETAVYLANKHQLHVRGVDLLDFNIKKADEKRRRIGLEDKVEFQVMDYMKLDFPRMTFDGVYTLETLVHAPNYHQCLQEFYGVLKPGGKLALFEYSVAPLENLPPTQRKIMEVVIEGSGMHSLPHFIHGRFPKILEDAGFSSVSVKDITPRVMPMLKRFYQIAYLPYRVIKLLRLQRKFINITSAAEGLDAVNNDFWRYNVIIAAKK